MQAKEPIWGNETILTETCIRNTCIAPYMLIRKDITWKAWKIIYIWKQNIMKNMSFECFFFFSFLRTKTLNRVQNTFYWEKKKQQKCVFLISFFFSLLVNKTSKMQAKEPIWGNETILTETCISNFFFGFLGEKSLWQVYGILYG